MRAHDEKLQLHSLEKTVTPALVSDGHYYTLQWIAYMHILIYLTTLRLSKYFWFVYVDLVDSPTLHFSSLLYST